MMRDFKGRTAQLWATFFGSTAIHLIAADLQKVSHSVQLLFIKSLIQRSISANFLRTMLKHLSNKIREKVLSGKWPAETAAEFQMLKDFRASKMSVKKFLKKNWN